MLSQYIEAVLGRAVVVADMEDGTFSGHIPGFYGVFASATTEKACQDDLKTALEQWVIFRASRDLDLPKVDGVDLVLPKSPTTTNSLERIQQLEKQIDDIKLEMGGTIKPRTLGSKISEVNDWYKNYFTIISTVLGLIVVVVAFFVYRVKPWRTYEDNRTRQVDADYYTGLGDRFMIYGRFDDAVAAYGKALEVDKYHVKASEGLRTAEIFDPLTEAAYSQPEVTDVQLTFLRKTMGNDPRYAFLLLNAEGIVLRRRQNCSAAKEKFQQAIEKNPNFVDAYAQLGYTNSILDSVPIKEVTANFESAKQRDPDSQNVYAPTLRDLGYGYFLEGRIPEAIKYLSDSYNRLMRAEISIKLGDAYRQAGDLQHAIYYHQFAMDGLETLKEGDEEYFLDQATFIAVLNVDSPKTFVQVVDRQQYKIFLLYALSFDRALQDQLDTATEQFNEAFSLDAHHLYSGFFAHQIRSLIATRGVLPRTQAINDWFNSNLTRLSSVKAEDDRVSRMCNA
jgi:tetratricopeptide (TPR) repeat protein/predicted RNase H-like HicB family nuclease